MTSKSSSKSQITGYRYTMAVHMGIGRGPIDELKEIRVGDLVAWQGDIVDSQFDVIDAPKLFGGDEKEGGIDGTFKVFMGEPTQTIDTVISDHMVAPVPGWRGVATLFYYGQIGSNNPYPKVWKLRVRRAKKGWDNDDCWYPDAAAIALADDPLVILTFHYNPKNNQTIVINGTPVLFQTTPGAGIVVAINDDPVTTVANFVAVVNDHVVDLGNVTAEVSGNVVELRSVDAQPVVSSAYGFVTVETHGGEIVAMNPAHIILEAATNNVWGRGLPRSALDLDSFTAAANTLYGEGFGLCIRWNRQEDIDKFVQTVINHIGAALFIDRTTGLLTLNLIRDDYVAADLPEYTFESGLIEITEDQLSSGDTVYNEIIVKFNNPIVNQVGQVRVQNLASFQSLGTLISTTVDYLGCATAALALRLAQRDLTIQSSNLRRLTIKMNRVGWPIRPGDVFKISAPQRGIESMVLRAGKIDDGPITDGTITISAVQDVFSLPDTSFIEPQPSLWVRPDRSARIIDTDLLTEATYLDLAANLPAAELAAISPTSGFVKIFAKAPTDESVDYVIETEADGEAAFVNRGIAGFDSGAMLTAAIDEYDTALTFDNEFAPLSVAVGDLVLIDDEYMRLDAVDMLAGTMTVARGCIDTIPTPHANNAEVWFQTGIAASDFRDYATAELVHVKLLTRTTSNELDESIAPTLDITIASRQGLPYPPGNLQTNGIPWANVLVVEGDIVFTWSHRDRITQGNFVVEHGAGSTGPEAGTTYRTRVYDGTTGLILLRTTSLIATAGWTYTTAMAIADGDLFSYWFEIESVRDGLASFQRYRFKLTRTPGFDEGFDDNFDGGV